MASGREIATAIVNTRDRLKDLRNARIAAVVPVNTANPSAVTFFIYQLIDEALLALQKELENLK